MNLRGSLVPMTLMVILAFVPAKVMAIDGVLTTVVDSHLISVEEHVGDLRRSDNRSVFSNISRLENNIERTREQFQTVQTSSSAGYAEQLLRRLRDTRESVNEFRADVREELDEQAVDLLKDGVDWDEYRENRVKHSMPPPPGELGNRDLHEKLSAIDRQLSRMQDYLTRSVQVNVTEEEPSHQYEYLVKSLSSAFRHYLEDRVHESGTRTVSGATYRHMTIHIVSYLNQRSDTNFGSYRSRQLGQELRYQGRVLLELSANDDVHDRVLSTLNEAVGDLLPAGGSSDRYESLKR